MSSRGVIIFSHAYSTLDVRQTPLPKRALGRESWRSTLRTSAASRVSTPGSALRASQDAREHTHLSRPH